MKRIARTSLPSKDVPPRRSRRSLTLLALAALLVSQTLLIVPRLAVASAADCQVTASETIGNWWGPRSHTFAGLSEITSVDSVVPSSSWYDCANHYQYTGNILSTDARCRATFTVSGLAAGCTPTSTVDVAQSPLFLGGHVAPNVMFVLDDSGSMQFEVMPDEYTFWGRSNGSVVFVYPRANDVYGSSDYSNAVATVDAGNAYAALTRSPQVNTAYYNPSVTYTPWVRSDGTVYPNASPACAWHNPEATGSCPSGTTSVTTAARNLTVNNGRYNSNSWRSCNSSGACSSTTADKTYWPATYFWHDGGDIWDWDDYTKVEIRSSTPIYSGQGREQRDDCVDAVNARCTYAEEIQNFANWYTYYRSRILASRAGIGWAFSQQGAGIRVGFGAINESDSSIDGVTVGTVINGVRPFAGTDRDAFFDLLYRHEIPAQGTPLRRALDDAGRYFSRDDSRGPWSETPGESGGEDLTCRRSYTVLMTDGYWNDAAADTAAARQNNDGSDGPSITGPNDQSFTYDAVSPFADSWSNTLADVAVHYWKRDLRSDLANEVPVLPSNPAFWQHMTTFGVGLGVIGSVAPEDAFAAILNEAEIDWPQPSTSGTSENIDDLLHAAVNGRGGFFSAADPNSFSAQLAQVLQTIAAETRTSATAMAINSVFLNTESRLYQARFDSSDWSGQLRAFVPTVVNNQLQLTQIWDAEDRFPAWNHRNILSNSGLTTGGLVGKGIVFEWGSLSSAQQTALTSQAVLEYLRGRRDQELAQGGSFRDRGAILGDIVNSEPVFAYKENYGFYGLAGSEGSSYRAFMQGKAARVPMVYVGGNDGMLHGFNADSGEELFSYVPAAVYEDLASLADPDYHHSYFVDGDIHVSDAYVDGGWKTILVGTTGAGGRSVFALDVSDPAAMSATKVLWEFTHPDLGYTLGRPVIARLKTGTWAAIFGNGVGGASHTASLFIVDLATGDLIDKVDTHAGDAGSPNGLSGPTFYYATDVNSTYAAYAYAGDLQGNLWKFDLRDPYVVAFSGEPLFIARNASDEIQPITVTPDLRQHEKGGYLVLFGTGKFFSASDPADTTIQSVYGIWDNHSPVTQTDRSTLQGQAILYEVAYANRFVRALSAEDVNFATQRGWYLDLVSPVRGAEGERVIQPPRVWFDRLRVTTTIPDENPCRSGGRGWYMEMDLNTGGRLDKAVFDLDEDGVMDEITVDGDRVPITGIGLDNIGVPPTIVGSWIVIDAVTPENGLPYESGLGDIGGRQSWREIR